MDKKTLIKVAVVAVILLFVLEPIAINIVHNGKISFNSGTGDSYKKAKAVILMELGSYENYIIADEKYSELIDEIKKTEGVKSVTEFNGKTIIETNDTYETYKKLKLLGIEGNSDASFLITLAIADNKELNITDTLSMNIEPLIKPGTLIKADADVVYRTKTLEVVDIKNIRPIMTPKKIKLKFKVVDVEKEGYVYVIDWSDRNKARELGYNVSNIVIVNGTNIQKADFVKAIGEGYIIVNENMTNKSKVEEYYDVIEFKDTTIKSNESLNISFAKSVEELYKVKLVNEEYDIEEEMESTFKYSIGDEKDITVEAMFSDEQMLYIIRK